MDLNGEFNSKTIVSTTVDKNPSDDHYIYYCGQESLRRNGIALIINKGVQNTVLGCSLKNNRMISVIQAYSPTTDVREAEIDQFYEDLQDPPELTPKKMAFSS